VTEESGKRGSGWWKPVLVAVGAAVAGVIALGHIERHEVFEAELTAEQPTVVVMKKEHRSIGSRMGGLARSTRGWLRRKHPDDAEVAEVAAAVPDAAPPLDTAG
jgi:hypothetical protein